MNLGSIWGYKIMTNGDKIRQCNNKDLVKVLYNLLSIAIYSGGEDNRLLDILDCPEDYELWINKESDDLDNIIFE